MAFKRLSLDNWMEPDPTNAAFGRVSPIAGPVQMDGQAWAREFLAVELKEHVPAEVRSLFDVARGALLYGWFFYPLFRLGEEQVHRVVEAAATERYRQLGGPKRRPSFAQAIEWLVALDVIPAADRVRWDAARKIRNYSSHPKQQAVMPPGAVLGILKASAHDINRLFARGPKGAR